MVMAGKGFLAAYPEADPATVLTPEAAASTIADEACVAEVIRQFAGTSTSIVVRNPAETPPMARAAARETPPGTVRRVRRSWCCRAPPTRSWSSPDGRMGPEGLRRRGPSVDYRCTRGPTTAR